MTIHKRGAYSLSNTTVIDNIKNDQINVNVRELPGLQHCNLLKTALRLNPDQISSSIKP